MAANPLTLLLPERRIENLRDRADAARDAVTVGIFPGELHVLLSAHEDARRLAASLAVANGSTLTLENLLRQVCRRALPVLASVGQMENMPAVLEEELSLLRDALYAVDVHNRCQGLPPYGDSDG